MRPIVECMGIFQEKKQASKVKVCVYLPWIDRRPTGMAVYLKEVVPRLLIRFRDPTVVVERADSCLSNTLSKSGCRVFTVRGSNTVAQGWRAKLARLAFMNIGIRRVLSECRADVLYLPMQDGAVFPGVPQVMTMHDLTSVLFPEGFSVLNRVYTAIVVRRAAKSSASIIAVSNNTRKDLVDVWGINPRRIRVVHEGYDPMVFRPCAESDSGRVQQKYGLNGKYLMYSGTLARHKNLNTVIDALGELRTQGIETQLVLCGRKDVGHYEDLMVNATRKGLGSSVRHLGYLDQFEMVALLSNASAFVFPSRYEGFGLAVLEAMACGAPVIASRAGAIPEVVGDSGILLNPDDITGWADSISTLLVSSQTRMRLAKLSVQRAKRFDWGSSVDEISTCIRSSAVYQNSGLRNLK